MVRKVAIVILNWNGLNDTLACLASIKALSYPHVEVIIVDNASSDGSAAALRHLFPDYFVMQMQENLGFTGGNNVGIQEALHRGADYVLLLNNDTVVAPDLIDNLLCTYTHFPQVGIVGATLLRFDDRTTLDHLGGIWDRQTATFHLVGAHETHKPAPVQELDYVCGAALMISKQVFDAIGVFDPRFFLIWEEADLCFRARRHGFRVLSSSHALVWHKVSASFAGGKPHLTYFWWRNRLLWMERNCSRLEYLRLIGLVILPEVAHLIKICCLKTLQLSLSHTVLPHQDRYQKKRFLKQQRAALQGVRDYVLRRFGNAPAWVIKDP